MLPGAFHRTLPAYSNEIVTMLHGNSLASAITIVDDTGAARIIDSRRHSPDEALRTAAARRVAVASAIVCFVMKLAECSFAHLQARSTRR